tara:strand:+ start:334320 stop:335705 length:1386 start_codon:yes stop_codon:yes gene_type:complete
LAWDITLNYCYFLNKTIKLINSILKISKEKSPHLVVVGLGLSGVDFLIGWQERFKDLNVTIFDKSRTSPFLIEALFLIRNKKLFPISGEESCYQMENFTLAYNFSKINSIDQEKNVLYYKGGAINYDYLLIVSEFELKVRLKEVGNLTNSAFPKNSYGPDFQNFNAKKVIIEGHGLATMAMALKYLDYGYYPSIVCKHSRLAIGELPTEEAWLFSKYFKRKGVELYFETRIEKPIDKEEDDLIRLQITNGMDVLAGKVVVVDDEKVGPTFLNLKKFYSDADLKTNAGHCVLGYSNVYAVGDKITVVTKEEAESFTYLNGRDKFKIEPCTENFPSKQYVFKDLSWQTYGKISPEWGNDTQNFYWEHPVGDISFRLHYRKDDFSIKGIACLGLRFNKTYMASALQANSKAHDFINSMEEGLEQNYYSSEACSLIKKSFGIEFKKVIKTYRSSLLKRIVKKLFS